MFAVRDSLRRVAFEAHAGGAEETLAEPKPAEVVLPAALDASGAAAVDGVVWPPLPLASIWKTREPGEGEWQEPRLAWNAKREPQTPSAASHDVAPPAFYRTFVRPDPERPYSRVILVAMDMRQLDLDMEAGTKNPKPLTGAHGPGRIPRDPAVVSRVVAAFNGAFKTEHGNYGMMVNRRVLLPPQPSAASVVVFDDGRAWVRDLGRDAQRRRHPGVSPTRTSSPSDRTSIRSSTAGRSTRWDARSGASRCPGAGMQTERSGLCVTAGGQIVYAWADDVSATALAQSDENGRLHVRDAPRHEPAPYRLHLRRNHGDARPQLPVGAPDSADDRLARSLHRVRPKDFFYVLSHDGTPAPVDGAAFHPDPGAQPPPAWAPAIWSTALQSKEGPIELTLVEAGRARFRMRAGMKEPDARTGASPGRELEGDDAHRVVMAIGLGHAVDKRLRGLATDGRLSYPMHGLESSGERDAEARYAALMADADGGLSIVRAEDVTAIGAHVDLAELPLLLDDGAVVAEARRASTVLPRGALGLTPEGRVFVARGAFASDAPLVLALVRAGCRRAVSLDRGAHVAPVVARVGTSAPPRGRSDETSLYILSAPMKPRAFHFEAGATVAQAGHAR